MLVKAYLMVWNANRKQLIGKRKKQMQGEDLLEGYRAEEFIKYTDRAEPLIETDTDFMLKTLNYIKIFENGTLRMAFLEGTD